MAEPVAADTERRTPGYETTDASAATGSAMGILAGGGKSGEIEARIV